jgi:ribosome-interacting GTPase 1
MEVGHHSHKDCKLKFQRRINPMFSSYHCTHENIEEKVIRNVINKHRFLNSQVDICHEISSEDLHDLVKMMFYLQMTAFKVL